MITYYDKNGVELHHGDEIEFVSSSSDVLVKGPYFVHEDNDLIPLKSEFWGEKYTTKVHKSNVVKKPDLVLDARGHEINVGDRVLLLDTFKGRNVEISVTEIYKDCVIGRRTELSYKGDVWTAKPSVCVVVPS